MFSIFWGGYPRKVAKQEAEKAWDQALEEGYTEEEMVAGLRPAIKNWIAEETEPKHIPHAATWIRAHRFVGGLTVDVASLSKKPYTEFSDDDWRVYIFAKDDLTYAKKYMPSHIKKELGLGLELVTTST